MLAHHDRREAQLAFWLAILVAVIITALCLIPGEYPEPGYAPPTTTSVTP